MTKVGRKYSYTSLSTFSRCRQRYYWNYEKNYAPLPSMGQIRGSVGHATFGSWYLNKDRDIAIQAASDKLAEYEDLLGEPLQNEWDLLATVFTRYFDWAEMNDDFTVQAVEEKFEFEYFGHTLIGYIDGIATKKDGVPWLLEHKFQKQAKTSHLGLDFQSSIYLWAARMQGYDVRGVLYNVIRMGMTGIAAREPVVRLPVYRNNEGLEFISNEILKQMNEMDLLHLGEISVYRNPTRDCSWDCGFYDACLALNDNGRAESVLQKYPVKVFDKFPVEGVDDD